MDKARRWWEVDEGSVMHGFDGFALHVVRRPMYTIVLESMADWLFAVVDPCCRKIWRVTHLDGVLYSFLHTVLAFAWRQHTREEITYPVIDEWVEINHPQWFTEGMVFARDNEEPKNLNLGVECPKCSMGRINTVNTSSIEARGMCAHCWVRAGTYDGFP